MELQFLPINIVLFTGPECFLLTKCTICAAWYITTWSQALHGEVEVATQAQGDIYKHSPIVITWLCMHIATVGDHLWQRGTN